MTEKRSFDAIFVGGGVIGLGCAWRAARAARASPCSTAPSRRPAPPASPPGCWPRSASWPSASRELLEMTLASAALYPEFVAELEAASGRGDRLRAPGRPPRRPRSRRGGGAAPRPRPAALARARGRVAAAAPLPRARAGPDAVLQRRRPRAGEAAVDPRALTAALLAALARSRGGGADRDRGRRRRCSRASASPACGPAAGEELRAEAVVLATGAWSGQAEWLPEPARPPVRPVKGQILELRAPRRRRCPASGSSPPSASTWCRAPTAA